LFRLDEEFPETPDELMDVGERLAFLEKHAHTHVSGWTSKDRHVTIGDD
jgi:hypothetical protein